MNPIDPVHYIEQAVTEDQLEEHAIVSSALPHLVPHLLRWFESDGVTVYMCSPRSFIPLPQLSVAELNGEPTIREERALPSGRVVTPAWRMCHPHLRSAVDAARHGADRQAG